MKYDIFVTSIIFFMLFLSLFSPGEGKAFNKNQPERKKGRKKENNKPMLDFPLELLFLGRVNI